MKIGTLYETFGDAPFAGRRQRRDTVFAYMKQSLDGFDRRFDSSELELPKGPVERGNELWMCWRAVEYLAAHPGKLRPVPS